MHQPPTIGPGKWLHQNSEITKNESSLSMAHIEMVVSKRTASLCEFTLHITYLSFNHHLFNDILSFSFRQTKMTRNQLILITPMQSDYTQSKRAEIQAVVENVRNAIRLDWHLNSAPKVTSTWSCNSAIRSIKWLKRTNVNRFNQNSTTSNKPKTHIFPRSVSSPVSNRHIKPTKYYKKYPSARLQQKNIPTTGPPLIVFAPSSNIIFGMFKTIHVMFGARWWEIIAAVQTNRKHTSDAVRK